MSNNLTEFEQVVCRGCGLDVHKQNVVCTIMGDGIEEETRTFLTYTDDLLVLSDWLKKAGITHLAMESTGVYWKPVYNLLENDFEIILVNARHIKNVPGHKTDKKDSAWIAKLLLSGLLKGSFIPVQFTRELRDLYRYKRKLIQQRVNERNRSQKILQDGNIKISSVLTDIYGKTGRLIMDALIEGVSDPDLLGNFAQGQVRKRIDILKKALKGNMGLQHRYMLATSRKMLFNIEEAVNQLDERIEKYLAYMPVQRTLLQTIPGVNRETIIAILGELGTDMSVFPDHHHLASWCGLCPGNNESAGKKKSGKITAGNKYLKSALIEAAWLSCRKSAKDSFLKRKFKSVASRRGKKKGLIAVAHKILIAAYYILRDKVPYQEPDNKVYAEKRKQAQINRYLTRLRELGIYIPSQS